jgi:hypothetical protein
MMKALALSVLLLFVPNGHREWLSDTPLLAQLNLDREELWVVKGRLEWADWDGTMILRGQDGLTPLGRFYPDDFIIGDPAEIITWEKGQDVTVLFRKVGRVKKWRMVNPFW